MITERDILTRLQAGEIKFPPLEFARVELDKPYGKYRPDATVVGRWTDQEYRFMVEIKKVRGDIARRIREVNWELGPVAEATGMIPLLITDWLPPERMDQLAKLQLSGIDLNGNGVVIVPGKLLIYRTGAPNQFRESVPLRNPYAGESAMVARAFFIRPRFVKVEDIWKLIEERGGRLSLSSVSKALKALDEDLMITRDEQGIRLLQPAALLGALVKNYRKPKIIARWLGKWGTDSALYGPDGELEITLPDDVGNKAALLMDPAALQEDEWRVPAVLTGASSATRYVTMAREPIWSFYVSAPISDLLGVADELGVAATRRFPNVELLQVEETWPSLDPRAFAPDYDIPWKLWASPLQCFLELATGDKRQREVSEQVRRKLLWRFEGQK